MIYSLTHLICIVVGMYIGVKIQQHHIKAYVLSGKNIPKSLESIVYYSDIGMGGRCPTCGGQNNIENDRCVDCNQKLNRGEVPIW